MAKRVMVIRCRAKASAAQHRRLDEVSRLCAELYNALLESWRLGYRWWLRVRHRGAPKPSASRFDLIKTIPGLRRERPDCAGVPSRVLQGVIDRHIAAVEAFYRRCADPKAKPGRPRFKSWRRWRTIEVASAYPSMLAPPGEGGRWWRLQVKGLPRLRFADQGGRLASALDAGAGLKRIRVVRRDAGGVEVQAVLEVEAPEPPQIPANPVGVDVGVSQRVAVSDGRREPGRVWDDKPVNRLQRRLSRARKGSASRRKKRAALARAHRRAAESRRQADHRLARAVLRPGGAACDGVAVEAIRTSSLMRNRRLSRRIQQQGWASLINALRSQAAKAGCAFAEADPAHTSRDCSGCGHRKESMPLSVRVYECARCGLEIDRDVNAAINICARGFPESPRGRVRTRHETGVPARRAIQTSRRKTLHIAGELDGAEHRTKPDCGKHTARI